MYKTLKTMIKRIGLALIVLFISINSIAQDHTPKYNPTIKNTNMDWYKVTFDVILDQGDTLNFDLINAINFNSLEEQRLEDIDKQVNVLVNDVEVLILLYSYQKCASKKSGVIGTNSKE